MPTGPIRTLTTVVRLVDRSRQGLRQLKKTEASLRKTLKRVADMKRQAANLNARIARKREAKLQTILKRGRSKLLTIARRAQVRATKEERRKALRLQAILSRSQTKMLAILRRARVRAVREEKQKALHLKRIHRDAWNRLRAIARRAQVRMLREQKATNRRELAEDKRQTRRRIREARRSRRIIRRLRRFLGLMAAPSAIGVALGAEVVFRRVVLATAAAADKAAVLAAQLNLSAQAVQEIEFASDIAGTKFTEVTTAIRRMGDNAEDATHGAGMAVRAFQELGISTADLKGPLQDTDLLLSTIIQRLEDVPKGTKKGGLLAQIFGRAGAKSGALLFMGLKKFNEFRKFARDVGAVIGTELTDASQRLIDQGFKVRAVIRGIRNDLALGLIPILTDAAEATVAWWAANREVIVSKFRFWIRIVREAFDLLWFALHRLDNLVNTFTNWGTVFSGITAAVIALTVALGALAATGLVLGILAVDAALAGTALGGILGALGAAFGLIFSAPTAMVLAFVAAVAALVLIFEDLLTFVQGGESVFGHFLEWLLGSKEAADSVQKMLSLLADVIKNGLLISFNYLFDGIVHDLGQAFDLIMKKVGEVVGFFLNLFGLGDSFSMGGFLGKGIEGATTFLEAQAADTAAILAAQRSGEALERRVHNHNTMNQTLNLNGPFSATVPAAQKLSVVKQNSQARRER